MRTGSLPILVSGFLIINTVSGPKKIFNKYCWKEKKKQNWAFNKINSLRGSELVNTKWKAQTPIFCLPPLSIIITNMGNQKTSNSGLGHQCFFISFQNRVHSLNRKLPLVVVQSLNLGNKKLIKDDLLFESER